jgi:polysaccharide export outer membrane protein
VLAAVVILAVAGCARYETLPPAAPLADVPAPDYLIGPGDALSIFVWRNPEVTRSVVVRPDGRISAPLIEDLDAAGKTPTQLAREIERELSVYIQDPLVTVMVQSFSGTFEQQVRVVGEAAQPRALSYRANMTLLDVIIAVGGITDFAAGNRASIVRIVDGQQQQFGIRIDDLIRDGDITANVAVLPGDVIIIPESWF